MSSSRFPARRKCPVVAVGGGARRTAGAETGRVTLGGAAAVQQQGDAPGVRATRLCHPLVANTPGTGPWFPSAWNRVHSACETAVEEGAGDPPHGVTNAPRTSRCHWALGAAPPRSPVRGTHIGRHVVVLLGEGHARMAPAPVRIRWSAARIRVDRQPMKLGSGHHADVRMPNAPHTSASSRSKKAVPSAIADSMAQGLHADQSVEPHPPAQHDGGLDRQVCGRAAPDAAQLPGEPRRQRAGAGAGGDSACGASWAH